jgi:hypothetical protein
LVEAARHTSLTRRQQVRLRARAAPGCCLTCKHTAYEISLNARFTSLSTEFNGRCINFGCVSEVSVTDRTYRIAVDDRSITVPYDFTLLPPTTDDETLIPGFVQVRAG